MSRRIMRRVISSSRRNSPVRCRASPFRKSSRGCSPSTIPFGACPVCGGIGCEQKIDADLVVPNPKTTLRKGAVAPWAKSSSPYYMQTLEALGRHYKFRLDTPWEELPKKAQNVILSRLRQRGDSLLLRRRLPRL